MEVLEQLKRENKALKKENDELKKGWNPMRNAPVRNPIPSSIA